MENLVADHCWQLERCNQRGGRMLSVFDLIEARTLDLDLASYLMARISRGASFLVGAVPGGAGKTTVMCALLNLVPADVILLPATPENVRNGGKASPDCGRSCYVCHEIGRGSYFAYLWGEDLRRFCLLADERHILATNLHADTMAQAREQICLDNGVSAASFHRFHLLVFLAIEGGSWRGRRRVSAVYESDGAGPHGLLWATGRTPSFDFSVSAPWMEDPYCRACREFLRAGIDAGIRTIEQTRERVLAFLREQG